MKRIFILTLLIVLLIPAFSYAADYTIYTWGYMDILASMLTAVNKFMGTSEYGTMFKIAALLATFTIFLSLLSDKGFSPVLMFQKILLIIGLQALLFSPLTPNSQTRVIIQDVSDGVIGANPTTVVEGTPIIVAFPLYVLSNIEKATRDILRDQLNKAAGQNGVFLHDMSVITALNMMDTANNMRISDVNFIRSYQSFFENCIMPDVVTGYVDVSQLTNSDNAWDIFGVDLHKSRIGSYYDASTKGTIDGKIMTCDKLYAALDNQIGALGAAAENQISGQLGLAANQSINTILGSISKDLFNFQNGQTGLLQNAMMLNTFSDAYANLSSSLGMEDNAMGYGMAKAQETAKMTGAMQAVQAKKYLPTAKGYMTVIFVAMIPLIIIIALVTSNFKKPFAMIFGLLLALALWNVGEQLLDFIIIVRTKTLFASSGLSNYNLDSQPFLSSGITDMLNLSLNMYWMIPTLAFSIATLSGFGAASMMGSIAGSANAGIGQAAAEAATGSMSAGNIRMSNINMNKYDAAQTMNAGTSTKMSMDYQQTASNQSSVQTGTRNIHDDADSIKHEGSTWIQGPNGQQYELNGTFKQTAAGWEASGTFIDQNGKSWSGTMTGTAKNMEAFQNNVKNGDEAVLQAMSIDTSNLSRSHERHQDNISTANDVDQANRTFERKDTVNVGNSGSMSGDNIMVNGESVSGKVSWNGDTATIEGTKDGMKYTATVENASIGFGKNGMSVTGDIVKSNSEGGNSTNINNSYSEQAGQKLALGDEITGHGGARGVLKEGFSKYIGNSEDAEIAKDAFFNNLTQNQNAILSQSGSNKTAGELATSLRAYAKGEVSLGIGVPGGTGAKASLGVEAAIGASLRQVGENATSADFNRIMNEQIFNNVSQQVAFGKIKAEDFDKALEQAYDAYNNVLKDIAKGTGSMNPYTETEGMVNMPTNPSKK